MTWRPSRTRPYALDPLVQALGLDPADTAGIAAAVGRDRRWIKTARRRGLTEQQADHWATRAGLHPSQVWPRWGDTRTPPSGLANANKTTCPNGHPYDATSRGRRICRTCKRSRVAHLRAAKRQVTQVATRQEPAMTSPDDTSTSDLLAALGGHATASPVADQLDLPLPEQVRHLIALASDHNPSRTFTRTVPVQPTDHDVLIYAVLRKLIHRIADLDGTRPTNPQDPS